MKQITVNGIREDFQISRIALGTGSVMKDLEKDQVFELFDLYVSKGGNVLDTAPGYCRGRSEKNIGEWMKLQHNREQMIISTKACHAFPGEPSRLTLKDMNDDLNLSLSQLDTDYVDILWIHNDDPAVPIQQIMDDINKILESGRVRAIGCSNWTVDRLEMANAYAKSAGLHGFCANQIQWSLASAETGAYARDFNALCMDEKSYDWYVKNDIMVFAFSAAARGFFSVAVQEGIEAVSEKTMSYFGTPDNIKRLENVKKYMAEHNCSASVPVIGYITNNRLKGVALTGASRPETLLETMEAANAEMTWEEADSLYHI
ncbi:MAG: aldo/keto reductase [Anaerolineaceae bacterium]|nr:aldo/keto reductase [Anaerolineaceae bacterium]